ncbi:unnamed protein product [Somion occarium]|uniref:Uncharacterized protein n=1 Tax=Somion occarium TaxID=3059160 RepID=A0ABP1DCL8_9APHY
MPRKNEAPAPATRTRVSRARAKVAFREADSFAESIDENQEDIDVEDEDGGDEDQMLDMINMLKEFQKRKASASSSRNAAFQNKKNSLYADARKNAELVVTEGIAYVEQFRTRIAELRANEVPRDQHLKQLTTIMKSLDEPVREVLNVYPNLFQDLSRRRAGEINETSAMLESHIVERQYSRRKMIKNAKVRMDDGLEQQKLATDASALIKHYKALLLM